MPQTVLLGSNRIVDCDSALVVEGAEVFRLRERGKDGHLVVDFDLRDASGTRIAKIAKNYVAHAAPGYEFSNRKGISEVIETATGQVVARVEERGPDTIAVTGTFNVKGYTVQITSDSLVAGGVTMDGNEIRGFGKAIELKRGVLRDRRYKIAGFGGRRSEWPAQSTSSDYNARSPARRRGRGGRRRRRNGQHETCRCSPPLHHRLVLRSRRRVCF